MRARDILFLSVVLLQEPFPFYSTSSVSVARNLLCITVVSSTRARQKFDARSNGWWRESAIKVFVRALYVRSSEDFKFILLSMSGAWGKTWRCQICFKMSYLVKNSGSAFMVSWSVLTADVYYAARYGNMKVEGSSQGVKNSDFYSVALFRWWDFYFEFGWSSKRSLMELHSYDWSTYTRMSCAFGLIWHSVCVRCIVSSYILTQLTANYHQQQMLIHSFASKNALQRENQIKRNENNGQRRHKQTQKKCVQFRTWKIWSSTRRERSDVNPQQKPMPGAHIKRWSKQIKRNETTARWLCRVQL